MNLNMYILKKTHFCRMARTLALNIPIINNYLPNTIIHSHLQQPEEYAFVCKCGLTNVMYNNNMTIITGPMKKASIPYVLMSNQ